MATAVAILKDWNLCNREKRFVSLCMNYKNKALIELMNGKLQFNI